VLALEEVLWSGEMRELSVELMELGVVDELVLGVVLERVELLSVERDVSVELELVPGLLALVESARLVEVLEVIEGDVVVSVVLDMLELGVVLDELGYDDVVLDELGVDDAVLLVVSLGLVRVGLLL
jgi:hypothetical protein